MMIYKYPVTPRKFTISMPETSSIVSVQAQGGEPQMWAIVDPTEPTTERHSRVVATGEHFEPAWSYIGIFQLHGGGLVFHLLEERRP